MQQYLGMVRYILQNGDSHQDRTGVGTTSVFGYQNRYDLREGFPLLTTKKMFIRGIVEELIWFLHGHTDNKILQDRKVKIWDEWATAEQCAKFGRAEGDLGPIYGFLWRNYGAEYGNPKSHGIDQIEDLVYNIINHSNSRRLIVTGWDPRVATKVALPPCHTLWHCKVIESDERYLDLQLYQRSADLGLGVPFNIASYSILLQLLAMVCDLKPRYFIHTFGDLHIYTNHIEDMKEQLERTPYPLPTLAINERLRGGGLEALLAFTYEDVLLSNYQCHPAINMPVAV